MSDSILVQTIRCESRLTKARHERMSEEESVLKRSAKVAYSHARLMQFDGSVPTYLGVNGMLALMHDSIRRYIEAPTREDLLSLVAHGIHALALEEEEEEWEDLEEEEEGDDSLIPVAHRGSPSAEFDVPSVPFKVEEETDDGSGRWAPAPGSTKTVLPAYDPEVDNEEE